MLTINIINKFHLPIYKQLIDQIKQQVANYQLKPGEQLPTVRELAQTLHCNPATVAHAYQELARAGILGTNRRRGTIVMGGRENPDRPTLRQSRLAGVVDSFLLDNLSRGYTPEELEATFALQLARWHFQRNTNIAEIENTTKVNRNIIRIIGSNDLALDLLISRLKQQHPEIDIIITPAGSLGGLIAIQEGSADMAGIHLYDEETGTYNYPYIKHVLQGIEVTVVHLADRIQGLMVAKDNPKHILSLEDLKRPEIIFVNRQKGSGTRVWLDYKLRELEIQPHCVKGYNHEVDTHWAVALSIIHREADTGLGIQTVAMSNNLDFIPTTKEKFDLVIPNSKFNNKIFVSLLEIIRSNEFIKVVDAMGGYDTSQIGETVIIK